MLLMHASLESRLQSPESLESLEPRLEALESLCEPVHRLRARV